MKFYPEITATILRGRAFRKESVSPGRAFSLEKIIIEIWRRLGGGSVRSFHLHPQKNSQKGRGYCWVSNPEPDIPFDAMLYRANDVIALRVRTSRKAPNEFVLYEDFSRADYEILRDLPLTPAYCTGTLGAVCMEPGIPAVPVVR